MGNKLVSSGFIIVYYFEYAKIWSFSHGDDDDGEGDENLKRAECLSELNINNVVRVTDFHDYDVKFSCAMFYGGSKPLKDESSLSFYIWIAVFKNVTPGKYNYI